MESSQVIIGGKVRIGGGAPIVVQTMCNTHTYDIQETVEQCLELSAAGAELIRITVPGLAEVDAIREIHTTLRSLGCTTPLVADIHFSSETAIAVARIVEKVRINPGNFHRDHNMAREQFGKFLQVCKEHGTAIRIGLNHGSLGSYITDQFGNTPLAMAKAAMEWIEMCLDADFRDVVVSLKASNTVVVVEAYELLVKFMEERGVRFPLHVGVTEAGNGIEGRIKSCVAMAALLEKGIGDTIRVSLTEPPVNEIPVAQYLARRYSGLAYDDIPGLDADTLAMLDAACTYGPKLLSHQIDELPQGTPYADEIMQAARRKFYRPEYIACPGCGRTMYNLEETFNEVKRRTSHLKGMVIAVMGCIVNGPGEMADADWGYVGEGNGKVSIYRKGEPVLRHIPSSAAIDKLLQLISED